VRSGVLPIPPPLFGSGRCRSGQETGPVTKPAPGEGRCRSSLTALRFSPALAAEALGWHGSLRYPSAAPIAPKMRSSAVVVSLRPSGNRWP
jgi:hypothetical protein